MTTHSVPKPGAVSDAIAAKPHTDLAPVAAAAMALNHEIDSAVAAGAKVELWSVAEPVGQVYKERFHQSGYIPTLDEVNRFHTHIALEESGETPAIAAAVMALNAEADRAFEAGASVDLCVVCDRLETDGRLHMYVQLITRGPLKPGGFAHVMVAPEEEWDRVPIEDGLNFLVKKTVGSTPKVRQA